MARDGVCQMCKGKGEETVSIHGKPAQAVCRVCGGTGRQDDREEQPA